MQHLFAIGRAKPFHKCARFFELSARNKKRRGPRLLRLKYALVSFKYIGFSCKHFNRT